MNSMASAAQGVPHDNGDDSFGGVGAGMGAGNMQRLIQLPSEVEVLGNRVAKLQTFVESNMRAQASKLDQLIPVLQAQSSKIDKLWEAQMHTA